MTNEAKFLHEADFPRVYRFIYDLLPKMRIVESKEFLDGKNDWKSLIILPEKAK